MHQAADLLSGALMTRVPHQFLTTGRIQKMAWIKLLSIFDEIPCTGLYRFDGIT
jgi:hypothetical protein